MSESTLGCGRSVPTRPVPLPPPRAGPEHIRVNGNPVKASQSVIIGDTIRVRESGWERILEVRRLIAKRVGAEAASHCFTDHTPPRPVAPKLGLPQRDRGAGRPTKKDRRDMEKRPGCGLTHGYPQATFSDMNGCPSPA